MDKVTEGPTHAAPTPQDHIAPSGPEGILSWISRRIATIESSFAEVRCTNLIRLACEVAAGRFPQRLLDRTGLSPKSVQTVTRLARDIRESAMGPGESALDDVRWEDMTLAALGVDPSICLKLADLRPPVVTVGDWEELVKEGSPDGLDKQVQADIQEAVEAYRMGCPR